MSLGNFDCELVVHVAEVFADSIAAVSLGQGIQLLIGDGDGKSGLQLKQNTPISVVLPHSLDMYQGEGAQTV